MDIRDLLTSLPAAPESSSGLLSAVSSIGLREHAPQTSSAGSASRLLLQEVSSRAASDAASPPIVLTNTTARAGSGPPVNQLHLAIVAGHKANMDEILSRKAGSSRQKSKRANKRDKKGNEKGAAYNDRFNAKTGGRENRSQRMSIFKKQY